jgi:adenylate kinase
VIILLFGPPGCGKGTQAAYLTQLLQIPAISTGEMLRAECEAGTRLGHQAQAVLARGELLGDDLVNELVAARIVRPDCAVGFLLDGYPRTVPQAQYFCNLLESRGLPRPAVVHFDVPLERLVARLTARRQCPKCHRIYNLMSQPPRSEDACDDDGSCLIAREDDRESVIRERLRAYRAQTGPVLDWFGASRTVRVDGSAPPDEVANDVMRLLLCRDCDPEQKPCAVLQSRR